MASNCSRSRSLSPSPSPPLSPQQTPLHQQDHQSYPGSPTGAASEVATSATSYFRRQFDVKMQTRRLVLERRRMHMSPTATKHAADSTDSGRMRDRDSDNGENDEPGSNMNVKYEGGSTSNGPLTDGASKIMPRIPMPDAAALLKTTLGGAAKRLAPRFHNDRRDCENDRCIMPPPPPNPPPVLRRTTQREEVHKNKCDDNMGSIKREDSNNKGFKQSVDEEGNDHAIDAKSNFAKQPLHQTSDERFRYYKVVYSGVVALLSEPSTSSKRSGTYVSYGEVIASKSEIQLLESGVADDDSHILLMTPRRGSVVSGYSTTSHISPPLSLISQTSCSVSSLDTHRTSSTAQPIPAKPNQTLSLSSSPACFARLAISVDKVLTGGYAMDMDGNENGKSEDEQSLSIDQTPKRTNAHFPTVLPSPLPVADSLSIASNSMVASPRRSVANSESDEPLGYLISHRHNRLIVERLQTPPPQCFAGSFLFKVISSSPLPVLTGPSVDAPKTKAMLLPGTIHEVCLRVQYETVAFLRLARRRGWVADHKSRPFRCMKDVTNDSDVDCSASIASATTVSTPVSAARCRHRPPRRRRGGGGSDSLAPLPRHVINTHIDQPHHKDLLSPSSNISMLSDDASIDLLHHSYRLSNGGAAVTPDRSDARNPTTGASQAPVPSLYLMRVNAPRGLKILDAPHFQVSSLIHGASLSSSPLTKDLMKGGGVGGTIGVVGNGTASQSIFKPLPGGHHAQSGGLACPAVFDAITKVRKLPRGVVFEASSKRLEGGGDTYGRGLIKLSDNSGWAIVPRQSELDDQYRSYHGSLADVKEGEVIRALEEVGNAMIDEQSTVHVQNHHQHHTQRNLHPGHRSSPVFLRIVARGGVNVSLPSLSTLTPESSPTSSTAGSSSVSGSGIGIIFSHDSDVTSSVGSSFLDSMFRTPKKKEREVVERIRENHQIRPSNSILSEKHQAPSVIIPCGICVEIERWSDSVDPTDQRLEFVRLRGGQGWIPRYVNGKVTAEPIAPPEIRFGSFWFRVQVAAGIKVRLGPSRRAPSIKSDDGVYFRFECGEYLRASEILTVFREDTPCECFAKLYRNRHVQLQSAHGDVRQLVSLTTPAEWVQVFNEDELFLEECAAEPRVERHREGWRYNVVLDTKVRVRRGPSFTAETLGKELIGGESVLINERVTGSGEDITWLRLKDGQGWVHNYGRDGEALMIPHSLRHRKMAARTAKSSASGGQEDIAYNTIVARLFHSDLPGEGSGSKDIRKVG